MIQTTEPWYSAYFGCFCDSEGLTGWLGWWVGWLVARSKRLLRALLSKARPMGIKPMDMVSTVTTVKISDGKVAT